MRFNLSTAILACAAIASAGFTIPDDLPHGSYEVSFDDADNANFTLIDDVSSIPTVPAGKRTKRAISFPSGTSTNYPNTIWFNANDFFGSNYNNFREACSHRGSSNVVGNGKSLVNYAGDSLAFMCSYAKSGSPCSVDEWGSAVDMLVNKGPSQSGGSLAPAWLNIPAWYKVRSSFGSHPHFLTVC